jgi:zinc D-Ala-D-Ala carboxypeptidase
MTIEERIIPCTDLASKQNQLAVKGWQFIGSSPVPGRDNFCLIRYDDMTILPGLAPRQASTAPASAAPHAVKLSPHFTLDELTESQTAARKGLNNTPPAAEQRNLERLAESLEAIREAAGKSIRISSGYRSPAVNKAVGGSPSSAHVKGLAADINVPGMSPKDLALLVAGLPLPFDQIILEFDSWVHVGLSDGVPPRNQLLTIRKGTGYVEGIV